MAKKTDIAPTGKSANVRAFDSTDAQQVVQRIQSTATTIHLDLSGSPEDWQRDAIEDENRSAALDARRGLRLIAIKQNLGHGKFTNWLEQEGFSSRRVQELMQVAQFLLQTQEGTTAKLVGMDSSKLITLAKLPIETIEDAAANGELDEFDEMSVRELKSFVRKLQNQNDNLSTEISTTQIKLKAATEKSIKGLPKTEFPDFVTDMRMESHALSEKSLLCIDSLEQMLNDHLQMIAAGGKSKAFTQSADIATASLYLQIQNIAARSCALTSRMRDELGADEFETSSALLFNDAEIQAAIKSRDLLVQEHKVEAMQREMEREMKKPKAAGRPSGSKTQPKKKK